MATAVSKALASKSAQASIKARANNMAKSKIAEAAKALRQKFRDKAPALRKDFIEAYAVPAVAGVVGAHALDFTVGAMPWAQGAKGDLLKGGAAIAIGVFGKRFVKSPYLQAAAVGGATVNLYKLTSRLFNRTATGTLNGLFGNDGDADLNLSGLVDSNSGRLTAVQLTDPSGATALGYMDNAGNVFNSAGQSLNGVPAEDGPLGGYGTNDEDDPRY